MSINMIGALLGAPIAGLLSDRLGKRRLLAVGALAANGVALLGIAWAWHAAESYALLLALRLVEGFAHMSALSLLMALAADHAGRAGLGRAHGRGGRLDQPGRGHGRAPGRRHRRHRSVLGALRRRPALARHGRRSASSAWPRVVARAHAWPRPRSSAPCAAGASWLIPLAFSFADRLTVGFIVSTLSLYLGLVIGFDARQIGLAMAAFLIPFSVLHLAGRPPVAALGPAADDGRGQRAVRRVLRRAGLRAAATGWSPRWPPVA